MMRLAVLYMDAKRVQELEIVLLAMVPATATVRHPQHEESLALVALLNWLADGRLRWGPLESFPKIQRAIVALIGGATEYEQQETADFFSEMSQSCRHQNNYEDTMRVKEQLLPWMQRVHGLHHEYTLRIIANVGYSLIHCNWYEEVVPILENLSENWLKSWPSDKLRQQEVTVLIMKNLAVAYNELRKHEEAVRICQRQLPLLRERIGRDHAEVAQCLKNLSTAYMMLGQEEEAMKMSIEGLDIAQKSDEQLVKLFQEYLRILKMIFEEIDAIETVEDLEFDDADEHPVAADASKSRSMRRLAPLVKALKIRE